MILALLLAAQPAPSVTQPAQWSDLGILVGTAAAYFTIHAQPEPWSSLNWDDTPTDQAYNEDTVPTEAFYAWAGALSLGAGYEGGSREAVAALHTLGLTGLSTEVLKYSFGRPRPDFDNRMAIAPGHEDEEKLRRDARLSMPSGHSSSAFALALHTGLWLHRAGCRRGWGDAAIIGGYAAPLLGAAAIGVSRVTDNRHNPSDVLAGALLGSAVAWGVNRWQFGPHRGCDRAQ